MKAFAEQNAAGLTGALVIWTSALACASAQAATAGRAILDESCYWRRYYRFGADLVSPAALRAEGVQILGNKRYARLKRETEKWLTRSRLDGFAVFRPSSVVLRSARTVGTAQALKASGAAPSSADWRDHVFVRMFFDPYTAPPPPKDWMAPDYDDGSWVLDRGGFQSDMPGPQGITGNTHSLHIA